LLYNVYMSCRLNFMENVWHETYSYEFHAEWSFIVRNSRLLSKKAVLYCLIALYIAVNLIYLTRYPFVHSDEPWLSGLSRNILEKGDYSVTEAFFDLKERHPHAIKIVFHTIQIIFIKLMGYSIFTFRFISLVFGLLTLFFMYRLGNEIFKAPGIALTAAALLAVDAQFMYAAHFARQEIIILFLFVLGLWYKITNSEAHSYKNDMILGCIIGLSIGIHPNSFIISLPFGLIYLYEILFLKERSFKSLAVLIATVAGFAAVFVSLSLYFDPRFISNYSNFGSEFDVFDPIHSKLGQIKYFYLKLFYRVSGTYYTPDIRLQFFLFGTVLIVSVFKLLRNKNNLSAERNIVFILLAIAAVNAGIIIIGRFNQTSIVFVFPLFYILVLYMLEGLAPKPRNAIAAVLITALTVSSALNYAEYKDNSYKAYLAEISKEVKPWNETLGNLNTEYYFENGKLHDYRNLAFLRSKGMSFEEYIRDNKIEYIIYSEELDLIHELRPKWDGIYGPIDWYEEMRSFIENNCELKHEFTDSYYGIRIVRYIGLKDWKIKIYRVVY